MAIAVASTSSTTYGAGPSCVITKPTGLAANDVMFAALSGTSADVITAPAGWTDIQALDTGAGRVHTFYKVADASDAAASDFTFSNGSAAVFGGGMLRITGASYNGPVADYDGQVVNNSDTPTFTINIDPGAADSLIIMVVQADGALTTTIGLSNYAIATSNPSWTEAFEFASSEGNDFGIGVAYAVRAASTNTGVPSFSYHADVDGTVDTGLILVAMTPAVDASISPDVINLTASIQAPSPTAGATVSPSVISLTASIQAPTAAAIDPDWTPGSQSSSSWTPQSKS